MAQHDETADVAVERDSRAPEPILRAAGGAKLADTEYDEALAWLLSDDEDGEADGAMKDLSVNVGGHGRYERRVPWTIKSVDRDLLKSLQKQGNRRSRRAGAATDVDAGEANARIVAAGTVKPDLILAATTKGVQAAPDPLYAPTEIVKHRFRHKPGLIDQIAGEILDLSGYDDEAVEEVLEVRAAQG